MLGGMTLSARRRPKKEGVMKAVWFGAALATAFTTSVCANAQEAGVFEKWLSQEAPECVPVSAFKSVSTVKDLTQEQFQFVRALYVALPPVSRTLPPGDHAVMASSGKTVMLALVADGQACARFLAPDFIQAMLLQVGEGRTVHIGTPVSWRPSLH
jgi:hypothetical protein